MFKKTTFIAFFLFAVFGSSDGISHIDANAVQGYRLTHEVLLIYAGPQEQRVKLQCSANKKSTQANGKEEFEELEEELQELIEEMKKLEKEAREKVLKEILPRIKEEIEKLREKLRKWRDEEDEEEPIKIKTIEI
jgi:predicted RNase H-like nuclease (RuvC/YqgF family)